MRFIVFGAGGVGSVVAARLSRIRHHDVSLVGREDHVRAIREKGLELRGKTELLAKDLVAVSRADELDPAPPPVILVTVKAYDTPVARDALKAFWKTAVFVSLQNGLGNEEVLAERASRVLSAVVNQGAIFLEPGVVFHAGERETYFGPFAGTEAEAEDAERVAAAFAEAGMIAEAVPDVERRLWEKTVLNAAVNPVAALVGLRSGELIEEATSRILRSIVEESAAIAKASGIAVEVEDVMKAIDRIARATPDNKPSMLQDLERGKRTEIDAINGALVERAERLGLPAPLNDLLTRLVRKASGSQPPGSAS